MILIFSYWKIINPRSLNSERKSCGFTNIQICVDGAFNSLITNLGTDLRNQITDLIWLRCHDHLTKFACGKVPNFYNFGTPRWQMRLVIGILARVSLAKIRTMQARPIQTCMICRPPRDGVLFIWGYTCTAFAKLKRQADLIVSLNQYIFSNLPSLQLFTYTFILHHFVF